MASTLKVDEITGSASTTISLKSGSTLDTSGGTLTLGSGTVGATQLATNSISTVKIEDSAVTSAKIADNAITEAKMADDAISSAELKSLVTINILASDGTTVVKTIFTPGS
jgi:hypothetical protein